METALHKRVPLGTKEDSKTEAKASEYEPSPEKQPKTKDDSCG